MSTEAKKTRTPKRTSPDLLDYAQAADRLNVSEATVRRMVDKGMLKSVSVSPSGRRRMIRVIDLEGYLETNAAYSPAPVESKPKLSSTVDAALRKAGWDGVDYLGYERKSKKQGSREG
jgi:excisionase family DNA binding protein